MHIRLLKVILFWCIFALAAQGYAAPLFGPEFEFTNPKLITAASRANGSWGRKTEQKAAESLAAEIKKICREDKSLNCEVSLVPGKWGQEWRVWMNDFDSFFQISWDPAVVEVIARPETVERMRMIQPSLQKLLFDTATRLGFTVPHPTTAGHVNLGVESAFEGDAELFLRMFVDYANHPELALGVLGHDEYNAPPLALLEQKQRNELEKIIKEFSAGKHQTIAKLAAEIQKRVYSKTVKYNNVLNIAAGHYQALSIKTVAGLYAMFLGWVREPVGEKSQRIEFRAVYGQKSYVQFIKMAELISSRIEYLNAQKGSPIVYTNTAEPHLTLADKAEKFVAYLAELDLRYEDYKELTSDVIRAYIEGTHQKSEAPAACSHWLTP